MGKKLSQMSMADMKEEMSIAGSPDKLIKIMGDMLEVMDRVDITNAAELINLDFVLKRLQAENRHWMRIYEKRTGQKIR